MGGVIAILGVFPDDPVYTCAEFHDLENVQDYLERYPNLQNKQVICSSDAHYLWQIRDKQAYFDLEDEPYSSDLVRHHLFEKLR